MDEKFYQLIRSRFKVIRGKLFYASRIAAIPVNREVLKASGHALRVSEVIAHIENGSSIDPITNEEEYNKSFNFTHCNYCGEELPEEEIRMGAANHRKCWEIAMQEEKEKKEAEDLLRRQRKR